MKTTRHSSRPLLAPGLGLLLAVAACSPKAPVPGGESDSATATATATATDGATTTSGPDSDGSTGGAGDTEPSSATDGVSATGETDSATTGATGSTSGTTGATGSTSGAGSTGGADPVDYGECPSGMAAECVAHDPLCVNEFGGGSSGGGGSFSEYYSFCTQACQTDDDCTTGLQGGTAVSKCIRYQNSKICALDCSFGQSCPDGYTCELNMCMNAHCDCSGDGCQFCP